MRDRRVDLERLARDRLLLVRRQARQRAHVVQAVGELDDDDADVLGHRHEHLAQVLDLRVFLRLVGDARQLGDAVDELRDLGAEFLGDLFARDDRVLDHVVEEGGGDRRAVHLHDRPGSRRRRAGARCTTRPRPAAGRRGRHRRRRRRSRSHAPSSDGSYDWTLRDEIVDRHAVVGIWHSAYTAIDAARRVHRTRPRSSSASVRDEAT